ncbi:Aminodeoxychorismate lyase [Perkinsela sp. CCAP 1560/4]|nr:Aminodeoxychorismate lyase [Perkinsela sp. CCAP 1560/4]|eukprot:KNH05566.1 Aminodeoxychorismate lyase [Perkinsela sp. CCAP 1560/4]
MHSSTSKYGEHKRHSPEAFRNRPLSHAHYRTSTRGRLSSGVNWQFEDQTTNPRNWPNVILQKATCVSPEVEEDYFPSIESSLGSDHDTDSLWSGSDDECTITRSSRRKPSYSAYRWIKSTKKEYFVSHSGKRSPFLKVNMAPPSPAGEHFKQSIEDIRRNLLPTSSPHSRTHRSRRYDSEAMRSSLSINGHSSRGVFSGQTPSLRPNGSEFYSVSHHYKIVKHHCTEFSCETLTRKQFYRTHIQPERYLRDIWTITHRRNESIIDESLVMHNTCSQQVSQLWVLLAAAHTLPFPDKSTFYWQKRKNTGNAPCFTFNSTGGECVTHGHCHSYCLCCGSDAHGAFACNVIGILDKIMRHYAKKCGMSVQTFEKAIGFYGDSPASVVIHRESAPQHSARRLSYTVQLSNAGGDVSNGETPIDDGLNSPATTDSSHTSSMSQVASAVTLASPNADSPHSDAPREPPTAIKHDGTQPQDTVPTVTEIKPQRPKKDQPNPHRRSAKKLTKEHTKATYEAALHRRSDNSFVALMLIFVIAILGYFYFSVDLLPPAEYLYDTV